MTPKPYLKEFFRLPCLISEFGLIISSSLLAYSSRSLIVHMNYSFLYLKPIVMQSELLGHNKAIGNSTNILAHYDKSSVKTKPS